jgi:hypothetical protein
MACAQYAGDHHGQFPAELKDLVGTHGMTADKLAKLISSPDKPNAQPAVVYRRPRAGKEFGPAEIILYEAEHQRRDGKVTAGLGDGHSEVMPQKQFDELIK